MVARVISTFNFTHIASNIVVKRYEFQCKAESYVFNIGNQSAALHFRYTVWKPTKKNKQQSHTHWRRRREKHWKLNGFQWIAKPTTVKLTFFIYFNWLRSYVTCFFLSLFLSIIAYTFNNQRTFSNEQTIDIYIEKKNEEKLVKVFIFQSAWYFVTDSHTFMGSLYICWMLLLFFLWIFLSSAYKSVQRIITPAAFN